MSKFLQTLFSVKNSEDKSHKIITITGIKFKFKKILKKSYALNSGERQTGKTIQEIRADHVNRYELATEVIKREIKTNLNLKGMDVFCGNGYGSWLINNKTGAYIDSIDGSKEAVEFAKKYYGNNKIKYSRKLFPFKMKKNYYDFIVSLESIEHVKDDRLFLTRLYDSLNNNGILIISTPNSEKNDLKINVNHFHYRHYNNQEFVQFSKSIGFELLEMYGQDVYSVNQYGGMTGTLDSEKMNLKKDYNGQFTMFVFRKGNKLKYSPTSLIIDTTMLCNNNCSFCWRSNNKEYLKEKNTQIEQKTMPFNIYKKIIDDACQYPSINWLSLCGPMGEPLLNENIEKFYEYAYNKNHFDRISINTNGLVIDQRDISKLLNSITEFSISVDSVDKDTYFKIHGHQKLDKVLDNIKMLVNFKRNNGCLANIIVRFTENDFNRGQIDNFIKFFRELGVDGVNYCQEHAFAGVNKLITDNKGKLFCSHPKKIINFDFLGNMTTCCLNWHLTPVFGNIKNRTIKQIWESKEKLYWNKTRFNKIPCKNCSGAETKIKGKIRTQIIMFIGVASVNTAESRMVVREGDSSTCKSTESSLKEYNETK